MAAVCHAESLIAHWDFDHTVHDTFIDHSGNNNRVFPANALNLPQALNEGRYGNALYFGKNRDYAAVIIDPDGFVTRVEYVLNRIITEEAKAMVQPTDADQDGKITQDESIAGIILKNKALAAAVFDGLDTNGDGAIAIPEYLRVWGAWARPNYRTQEARVARRLEAVLVRPAEATLFDMETIRDASTLEVEVLQGWYRVEGAVPTRQKLVSIHVGEIWPGQSYRMPVRMVVPADRKAKGFHLTGGNRREHLERDTRLSALDQALIEGGVGLVYTVVQALQQSGLEELGRASEERFIRTLNPRDKIQYWAWPATMMRAITTAYAEGDHFEEGKVAMSGGSKNGATPSLAIIHDERMTAVHASVSPIWDSPLRLCDRNAWDELEAVSGPLNHGFLGGHFGPIFNREALAFGHAWDDLEAFAAGVSDSVFITRNVDALRARGVDMLFHPGTHDFVAFDIAWGGAHHPDIPIYLGANTGHGNKRAHPQIERDQQNKTAFLLRHFFPEDVEPLLPAPAIRYEVGEGVLTVRVAFPPGAGEESGRIWWMYDRPVDGSPGYLSKRIPDDHCAEMEYEETTTCWTAAIALDSRASRIDFFSNHRKTIYYRGKRHTTYISSPYTRAPLRVGE